MSFATELVCPSCGHAQDHRHPASLCEQCGSPLLVRYDLGAVRDHWSRAALADRPPTLWRYRELLPVDDDANVVSLGEGMTPILPLAELGGRLRVAQLAVKDEGQLPTGTFKARGAALGISRAKELGIQHVAMPTAGNAGGAWATYAARAGIKAHIAMPADAPDITKREVAATGAELFLVNGLISDAGKLIAEKCASEGWFDASTMKEPYRVEGKKTMGLEIAEQYHWQVPDVIIYPTGGGVGLVGMWKAFAELEALGWIGAARPRLVAAQAEGCQPIVEAYAAGATSSVFATGAHTLAAGIRVPKAVADFLVLRAIRETAGTAVAVSDDEILVAMNDLASREGVVASPEGAATLAAARRLASAGWLRQEDRVLLLNTGSGLKYPELLAGRPAA